MLIKQMHQKNVIFLTIGILKILVLSMSHIFAYLCMDGCQDLMEKVMILNDVALVYVKRSTYRIHFWSYTKSDALNIMSNSNFVNKKGVL